MERLTFLILSFKKQHFCTTFSFTVAQLSPVEDNALVTARGDAATALTL